VSTYTKTMVADAGAILAVRFGTWLTGGRWRLNGEVVDYGFGPMYRANWWDRKRHRPDGPPSWLRWYRRAAELIDLEAVWFLTQPPVREPHKTEFGAVPDGDLELELVTIECPHCAEVFEVDLDEL
jgi:hypothetical protein